VTDIPYMELPSTRRLTALCEDIYSMRHAREFVLEVAPARGRPPRHPFFIFYF